MKILLGVSGSISAYKAIDLARALVKENHEVQVVLTAGATKFVVPDVFTYLGVKHVYHAQDDFGAKGVLHVDLARWCDVLVIAPTSANTLSRLASGQASDLLSSIFLVLEPKKNIFIFPAMNTNMLHHPFTKENMQAVVKLKTLNNVFVSPTESGILACEEVGEGKLPTVEEIQALIKTEIKTTNPKTVLVTTGATIVPLDPVRYLTNSSSGITGFYLAEVALSLGYKVIMVAGLHASAKLDLFNKHPSYTLIRTKTVHDMKAAVLKHLDEADLYVSSAAISDIEFETSNEKVKKESLSDSLKIKKAPDILKHIVENKPAKLKIIGFAAETDLSDAVLNKKMQSKPVDLLIGTKVDNGIISNQEVRGFNADFADYRFLQKDKYIFEGPLTKKEMAQKLFEQFK